MPPETLGNVDSEVRFAYNDFGQVSTDYQEHGAAVNTSTSPKVQYGYAGGGDNTIRPTTLTYPDGRVLNYNYGSSGSTDDALGRIAALIDNDGNTHLADYSYLGQNRFIEVDYPEPDLRYTLVGTAGGNDPDTGDIYLGLDRFGRIKDSVWYDYGSSVDADRVKYGYDRMGSRTFREQTVDSNSNHDEFYQYDQIDRLKQMDRGTLSAQKDSISTLDFAQCWTLDPTGNWQGFKEDSDGDSTWDLEQTRTSNAVNEITNITETTGPAWLTPVYNRAGNMTTIPKPSDPTTGYTATYDGWNRLVKLVDGANTVAEYRYDAAKRRIVKKTYSGGELDETCHFFYTEPSKWQVIEERVDASSDPDRQFIWGQRYIDDLVLRDRDTSAPKNGTLDERLYSLQDANWNVTSLANASGTIQERNAYDAYGTPRILTSSFTTRGSSNHAWETLYAGYRFDADTEIHHVRHRIVVPRLGWLQRDPIGYADGPNLYEYVQSNPAKLSDPTGQGARPAICRIATDPAIADILSCLCFAIGVADLIANWLPPNVSLVTGGFDCLCDFFHVFQEWCLCADPHILGGSLAGALGSWIWNIVGGLDDEIASAPAIINAIMDAVMSAMQEGMAFVTPGNSLGAAACARVVGLPGDWGNANVFV